MEAILPDTDPSSVNWIEFNRKYSIDLMWPTITKKRDPDPEHEKYHPDNFPDGKMDLFSDKPGKGN